MYRVMTSHHLRFEKLQKISEKRECSFSKKDKKKGYRCSPTFVNLKSNTMKNTLQRYGDFLNWQTFRQ